jgi:hypothetical protein
VSRGWYATDDAQAGTLRAWAEQQGLRYERYGVLPTVSKLLSSGEEDSVSGGTPARWAESLCTGRLPGGLEGTLAHFSYRVYVTDAGWDVHTYTVIVARVLDGIRVARDMEARPDWGTVLAFEREYGETEKDIDVGGLIWKVPAEEDEGLVRQAVAGVPADRYYSLRDGMAVVALKGVVDDRETLYQHCLAAAACADGMHAVARAQRPLRPGDALPEPRATAYRDWATAGAARVTWRDPPPDLDSAATGYAAAARRDPAVERRARRGRRILYGVFFGVAVLSVLIVAAIDAVANIQFAVATEVFAFVLIMGIGIALGRFAGRGAGGAEAHFRREAWGLNAFADEYARSRGLVMEDQDEFRRRFPMPLTGSPQRVMRGDLPGGVPGRIVLWRDRNVPDRGFVNMAIVAAPPAAARPPYTATPTSEGWLVITEQVDRAGRTVARLDGVATEATRLAKAGDLS